MGVKEGLLSELGGADPERLRYYAGYIQALKDISKTDFEDVE